MEQMDAMGWMVRLGLLAFLVCLVAMVWPALQDLQGP
jgi:hypothetical protein